MTVLSRSSRRPTGRTDAGAMSLQLVPSARRDDHVARLQRELDELLARRDDLDGVSGMADLLRQAVRWSA